MPNAPYDFAAIEKKWQKIWDEEKTFAASDDFSKPKYYTLIEFPYPSGAGPARRSSALEHGHGYHRPQKALAGL